MARRKPIPKATQDDLLTLCARRCCLCFGLRADFDEKKGQIAHLDHDPSNNALDNLAFLCFDHHDQYDSPPRLSKGLTIGEVKRYREDLYQAVAEMRETGRLADPGAPARAEVEAGRTDLSEADSRQPFKQELIHIPAGEFLMGSDSSRDKYAHDAEQPQGHLYLPSYYIAKTPVTNAQYAAFVRATEHRQPGQRGGGKLPEGKEDHPVVDVSWHDAMAYCRWLAETTGKAYRLPSEAEWEKAARGTDGRVYPWGDEAPNENRCNFGRNVGDTTPVGMYSPQGDSPYGCVDMAGNVWEWTGSLYRPYPYDAEDGREDPEAGDNIHRVVRGGSWHGSRSYARCASRNWYVPYDRDIKYGFRLACPN